MTSILGRGLNRVTDRFGDRDRLGPNFAVTGQEIPLPLSPASDYYCSICRTASELAQAMQLKTSGSLTGLGFLPLLDAKKEFYSSLKTTVFSLSIVVHAWCITSAAMLSEPQLRPELSPLNSTNDLERFVLQYGDSYISSVALGGEFIGVFTFHSETREQAERVEIELAAGGLVNGFKLGVDLHKALQQVKHTSGTSYNFNYQIRGTHKPILDPENMVSFAQSFGSSGFDQPALLNMSALGYETVPEINMAFAAVANNRELFTSNGGLMRQYQRIEELINQIDDIIESLRIYGIHLDDADELMTNRQTAMNDLTLLTSLQNTYKTSPTTPLQNPRLPSLEIGSPRIMATVIEDPETHIGHMEAPNGDLFDFPFDASTAVQSRVRLSGIGMEAGWRVDKLLLRYLTRDEAHEKDFTYGGNRGNRCGDKRLGVGESISAIFSEFGPTNIDKLRIINSDKWVLAGGGERGDKQHPVDWRRAPDQVVLGFTGRSNNNDDGAIYALQAVVARFDRIDWEPIDPHELLDS